MCWCVQPMHWYTYWNTPIHMNTHTDTYTDMLAYTNTHNSTLTYTDKHTNIWIHMLSGINIHTQNNKHSYIHSHRQKRKHISHDSHLVTSFETMNLSNAIFVFFLLLGKFFLDIHNLKKEFDWVPALSVSDKSPSASLSRRLRIITFPWDAMTGQRKSVSGWELGWVGLGRQTGV